MLNIAITAFIGLVALAGSFFPRTSLWDDIKTFGAISYPTSLDSLTNPSGTDSVATVSHSAQHSNANDALEALEAKLGITGSTAVANSFLVGNGSGSSIWSTYATGTNITATGQGLFGSLIAQASSTIIGGLTIAGNSTTTNATSTIGAFTNIATSTNYYGAGLTDCTGDNKLQWSAGKFSCVAAGAGATITSGLATSSSGQSFISGVAMNAGDTILLWSDCGQSNSSVSAIINIRPTNWATTSYATTRNDAASSVHTRYQATTTTTFSAESQSCDSGSSLMYELIQP